MNDYNNKRSISHRKLILGVGINDSDYCTTHKVNGKRVMCPYYRKWLNMLSRCYNKKSQKKRPGYKGCTVCDEWLYFMTFRAWMMQQDWKEKHLDKDILTYGTDVKIYSPETCMFIPQIVNSLIMNCHDNKSKWLPGVCYAKSKNKYLSNITKYGKTVFLGYFNSELLAAKYYTKAKITYIEEVAESFKDKNIKLMHALYNIAFVMSLIIHKVKKND